ncbi:MULTISPECIES: GvpL/GvpF family gas vesicle protein [unclassified Streptomyces]|uniref:GvpL/GvpF family gas vesicle protein n=1 Tax=unclassified Streptomyces TaxID=2593676 RepID=UPI0007EC2FA0|nr:MULTISPECIES: GvpL/GvpF family gas vesicle protein [unclassified Streptomyces]MCP3765629.1 GvpL/GvpF family gas vesicle protein [Streptomyces sp. MAR25Y5]OBQ48043.1 gas vesicle protein [Streptomyces sp. H-KF8]
MTEDSPEAPGTTALYVYAVCRADGGPALDGVSGVARGEPVRTLPLGSLTAIVQTVRAAEFTDEAWQERLTDEPELERYARAHHEVVSVVAAQAPTVPLPLATLYTAEDRAGLVLGNESARFHTALERIAHHAEWGVKVYAADSPGEDGDETARQPCTPGTPGTPKDRGRPAPGAGRAYLERRRNLRARHERQREDSLRVAETVDTQVCRLAKVSRRLRPHGPGTADGHRLQVLNATYLVADHRAAELELLVKDLRERTGAGIELSGPWVPYSFVGEV